MDNYTIQYDALSHTVNHIITSVRDREQQGVRFLRPSKHKPECDYFWVGLLITVHRFSKLMIYKSRGKIIWELWKSSRRMRRACRSNHCSPDWAKLQLIFKPLLFKFACVWVRPPFFPHPPHAGVCSHPSLMKQVENTKHWIWDAFMGWGRDVHVWII